MSKEQIYISIGELWDKYSILLIKMEKVSDVEKRKKIQKEQEILNKNMDKYDYQTNQLFIDLKDINNKLWDIEDKLRIKELNKEFDEEFISLARSVYITNDKRFEYKQRINNIFGSMIQEIKHYVEYN